MLNFPWNPALWFWNLSETPHNFTCFIESRNSYHHLYIQFSSCFGVAKRSSNRWSPNIIVYVCVCLRDGDGEIYIYIISVCECPTHHKETVIKSIAPNFERPIMCFVIRQASEILMAPHGFVAAEDGQAATQWCGARCTGHASLVALLARHCASTGGDFWGWWRGWRW